MVRSFLTPFALVLFLLFDAIAAPVVPNFAPQPSYRIKTIVLDAGHGGHDSGCLGASNQEKHVALAITLKLGKYIEDNFPDVKVIYTRKTDVFVELNERANIANRNDADLFISIHCNANDNPKPYGTETYVMGLHKSKAHLDVAKRENAVIELEDNYEEKYQYDPKDPTSHILFSLFSSAYLDQSISLATKIEDEFKNRAKRSSRGVKQAGFLVLYKTASPAVLVETGFLTNRDEEKFLETDYGQDLIASAVFRAFRNYKEEMERESIGGQQPVLVEEPDEKPLTEPTPEKPSEQKEQQPLLASTKPVVTDEKDSSKATTEGSDKTPAPEKRADAIEFRIQFIATVKKIDPNVSPYDKLNDIHTEKLPNGVLRYFSGRYYTPDEAKSALKEVHQAGFKDAFITAYQHNKQINVEKAIESFK